MKKYIVRTGLCLLVMILIMLSATVCAFAAERGVDIEVDSVVLDKGLESAEDGYYTVKVPIRITRNAGFVTIRFYAYHPEGIELSGWTDGGICSLSNNTPPIENNGTKNGIAVYYDGGTTVTNETDTGILITLEYKVPENIALGDIAITLKLVDAYEEDGDRVTLPSNVKSSCTMTNGKISVIETIPELDCVIYHANKIAKASVVDELITHVPVGRKVISGAVESKGIVDDMARFGVKANKVGNESSDVDRMLVAIDDVNFSEYPYFVLVYKTNIDVEKLNVRLATKDAFDESQNDHSLFYNQTRTVNELSEFAVAMSDDFSEEGKITGVYIPIYSISRAVMSDADYFDVQYFGFFKSQEDAALFDYAEYLETLPEYEIKFLDKDGVEICTGTYKEYYTVSLPEAPAIEGYAFKGWSDGESLIFDTYDALEDATLTAVYSILGDVNADGNVNTLDVIALARHLGDWEGYAEIDSAASDVNADGAVTAIDLICLSRHIANWTGYETFPLANNE